MARSNLARVPDTHPDLRVLPELSTEVPHYVGVPGAPDVNNGGGNADTLRLKGEIDADLGHLGVCYRGRIFRLFALEEIAQAIVEVQDALRVGGVHNPGGLFVRVLEGNTGRSVFR